MHPLHPKLGPRANISFAHPAFPPLGTSMPGLRVPFLTMDLASGCPFEDRPFPPHPLGENHKNKTGASCVPRGMFLPYSHFIQLFGPGHRRWDIYEAPQRYPCNRPNYRPVPTSLEVAFSSPAAVVFKLAHLLSACIYKQTALMFLKKHSPSGSLTQSLFIASESCFV